MKHLPVGLIAALVATQLLGVSFGYTLTIVFCIEAFGVIKIALHALANDEDAHPKSLDPNSPEYLSKFMPKN